MQKQAKSRMALVAVLAVFLVATVAPLYQDAMRLLISLDRFPGLARPALASDPTIADHPFSGEVTVALPWSNNQAFQAMQQKYSADILMGAYQTTLPDPLPGENYNFARAAELVKGAVVAPGRIFSLNERAGPYTWSRGYKEGPVYIGNQVARGVGGGVCKMATTLYNAAVLANLPVVQRRPHSMLVPYANPGQDATVSYGKVDLRIQNDTASDLLIWAETVGNTLYVGIYGTRQPPKVTWHHELLYTQQRPVIYRINEALPLGEERVISQGADGVAVKSWVTIEYQDRRIVVKSMGIDYYRPMARLVERGRGGGH